MDQILISNVGVRIQHARNGGETEIGPYKVDGYYENENGQNTSWNLTESSGTDVYTVTMPARSTWSMV